MGYLRERKEFILFVLPLIFFVSAFIVLPVIGTILNSFFQDVPFLAKKFLWIVNYRRMLLNVHFWTSVRFTLLFVFVSVFLEMVLGMVFALTLNEKTPFNWVVMAMVLLPWAIPVAIGARVWQIIYNYDYGLLNFITESFFGYRVNWLGSPLGAFFSLIVADVWKTTPFVGIILFAGLKAIPEELYEQAKIDGAGLIHRFTRITFPILMPVFIVALLFRTIDALRVFDLVYVLTGGGPGGATTSISLYAYKFFLLGDFGSGSAVSVALFIIALLLSIFYIKMGRFREAIE